MRNIVPYSQAVRDEIITRYQQSGLTEYKFCNLPDVPINVNTLYRWMRSFEKGTPAVCVPMKNPKASADLNIVCYNIGKSSSNKTDGGSAPKLSLQEMIKFQQDVYDCCSHLYSLSCNEKTIRLLSQIKGAL
ncbi:MAG: hypothetical protein RBR15_04895 [Sphaerochaeta sp.]|nr:hypothetical protein [Sphaerochaeta sp.]